MELFRTKTFCNPMPVPDLPRGVEGWMEYTGEPRKDYRSISDPSVLYWDNKWYLYPSYGIAWVSGDFAHWEHVPCTPYEGPGYSPTVIPWGDKFFMTAHSRPAYEADTPVGPFRLLGEFIMPDGKEFRPVDPALFRDDDGRMYMYWHESGTHPVRGCWYSMTVGAELDREDPRRLLCEPKVLNEFDPEHEWERFGSHNQDRELGWIEGQWMLKHNGRYYLIYSGSGTEFITYAMGAYYSDEGPMGPFTYQKNNPITMHKWGFIRGAGHGCIEHGPGNTLWAFYTSFIGSTHVYERRIGMDYIAVNEDGELYCPHITDTPQFAPGVVADQEKDGDTGLLPLTLHFRARHKVTSHTEGRDGYYALDDTMNTWWQPAPDDGTRQLTVSIGAEYVIEASRLIWHDGGLDYEKGILPGPYRYLIEGTLDPEEKEWFPVLDMTENTEDMNIDYRTFPPVHASAVRLTVTGAPAGIRPGVVSFVVFGKRAPLTDAE